jgi:hypothetical protein
MGVSVYEKILFAEKNSFTAMIALIMEAVRTSETSVYFKETTWRYIPESCHLHTSRRENLQSHTFCIQQ